MKTSYSVSRAGCQFTTQLPNLVLEGLTAQVPGTVRRVWEEVLGRLAHPGLPDDFPSPHTSGKPIEALAWVGGLGDRVGGSWHSRAGAGSGQATGLGAESPGSYGRAPRQPGGVIRQAPRSLGLCSRLDSGHLGP